MEMRIAGKEKGGVDYSSIFLFLLANCALGGGTRFSSPVRDFLPRGGGRELASRENECYEW